MGKMPNNALLRLWRLNRERQLLLVEAAGLLATVSVGLLTMPFRRVICWGSVSLADNRRGGADDCVWAVEAAARCLPFRSVCIHKGLVVQRMLRRRGIDATLHYGARQAPESGKLEAHVWVTVAGRTIIGGSEEPGFAPIAVFP